MMEWTTSPCRIFHRLLAPHARLYTEMVHANAAIHGDRARLLDFDASEHPLALQLGGSEPALLAQAARIGEDFVYDEINLNCGCPSERVQSGAFGACLMREPELVADCVAAMRAAVKIPVTVKCRIGVDEQDDDAGLHAFIDTVHRAGCDVFLVHARKAWLKGLSPKENREIPPLNYERVRRLRSEFPQLTLVLNGGLATRAAVAAVIDDFDGVMLGRAAYHQPYLLAELERDLFDADYALPDRAAVLRALRPQIEARLARGESIAHFTRHLLDLYQGQPGARRFRRVLSENAHRPGTGFELIEQAITAVGAPPIAA
ncbi:MAG: tRNA dihydrouridine(20/20a) synthase DusA [Xanthomonadales bacterium]|nr:tRNA dihydrouridine(20/20a) synthase DusA [Xanthomonadales bacterium]MCC6559776.1 tRNA dihydrouridine(20/20a) synthase DusA [Xanthomonadales bacterium]